jgi:hypothetical protein
MQEAVRIVEEKLSKENQCENRSELKLAVCGEHCSGTLMYLQLRYACISLNIRIGKGEHGYWNDVDRTSTSLRQIKLKYHALYRHTTDDMRNGSNDILRAIGDSQHVEELTLADVLSRNICFPTFKHADSKK